MKRARRLTQALVLAALACPAPPAHADDDVATAQVLFDEGRRRVARHDYEGACPKLAESQRLSPAIGTEFNLADCWEHLGKLASAWGAFLEVADQTHRRGETEREQAARARAAALEPRLGRLSIEVGPSRRITDLEVRRDGEIVRNTLWNVAVPVDGGEHRVEARAPGRGPWSAVVRTTDGQTASIAVPDLPSAAAPVRATGPVLPPATATSAGPGSTTPPIPPPAAAAPDHTAAFVTFGAAVVLAGVGVLGLLEHDAQVANYNADATCPSIDSSARPAHCDDLVNAANTWKTVAIVGFVTSGLAAAGGLTLWLTAPRSAPAASAAAIRCSAGVGAIGCSGTF
jgi:hypothetical protein